MLTEIISRSKFPKRIEGQVCKKILADYASDTELFQHGGQHHFITVVYLSDWVRVRLRDLGMAGYLMNIPGGDTSGKIASSNLIYPLIVGTDAIVTTTTVKTAWVLLVQYLHAATSHRPN